MASFGNLYTYNTSSGVVIPQTSTIKANVEQAFKDIFGADFSTVEETPNGRLIEALTLFFVDVCGVSAQNANGFNITQAVGTFLDGLGAMFGVVRSESDTDTSYRMKILASASRGSGFAKSISNAISGVTGVQSVVVLDNGNEDPQALPLSNMGEVLSNSISVSPHSVFICVRGGSDSDIASAIRATKSAGCGYTVSPEYGTATTVTLTDSDTGTSFTAKFYRPTQRYVMFDVTVNSAAYTGDDITSDTQTAIRDVMDSYSTNSTITKSQIIAAVASVGKNIICEDITITVSDTDGTLVDGTEVDELVVMPYKYVDSTSTTINVTVE